MSTIISPQTTPHTATKKTGVSRFRQLIIPLLTTLFALLLSILPNDAFAQILSPGCTPSAATSPITFGHVSSMQIGTPPKTTSTTNAGLRCGGSLLSILGASGHIKATVSSANTPTSRLVNAAGDNVPYLIFADPNYNTQIPSGTTIDYYNSSLINLLGLAGNVYTAIPMYYRTVPGTYNISAGTYSDTISINWDWDICTLISIGSICIGPRNKGTASSSIVLNLIIDNDCIVSAPDINFGTAPLISSFNPVTQTITITCTKGTPYTVGLNDGGNPTGGQRRLASGSNFLNYEIYQGIAGITRWGTAGQARSSASADLNPGSGTGNSAQGFIYHAQILPTLPVPPAGVYTDSILLNVVF